MSDTEALSVLQQVARRWAIQRRTVLSESSDDVDDSEMLGSLLDDISNQGWLPVSVDEWGVSGALTLARLGQALSEDAASVFIRILTHNLGLHLLGAVQRQGESRGSGSGIIAASPYVDYSRVPPTMVAKYDAGRWILNGYLPWVVNFEVARELVFPAGDSSGSLRLCKVELPCACCTGSERLSTLGLCRTPVYRVDVGSLSLGETDLVANDEQARARLLEGYRTAQWGATGLLTGLVRCIYDRATEYAGLRTQGGRRIFEHLAVRQLIDTASSADDFLVQLLIRLEGNPRLACPTADVRRQALLGSDNSLQVFGGSGYICPGLPERCWRDVRQAVSLCSSQ